MAEEVPIADMLRITRIVRQQLLVVQSHLFEGVRIFLDDLRPVVLEPGNAVHPARDAFGNRQAALGLPQVSIRVGDARRLAVVVDVGGVHNRMQVQRQIAAW